MKAMSPWRVEWLRLVRTRRLVALAGVFVFLGFAEPLGAYYLPKILQHANSSGIKVIAPPPVPADGINGYANNALLIGLIVMVFVVASACAVDARPALSAFYRTRAAGYWQLLLPRVVVTGCIGIAAYLAGLACAWYETRVLIGEPSAAAIAESAGLVALYLIFAAAVTAAASTLTRSTLSAAMWSIGLLLLISIFAVVPQLKPWLPSTLTGSPDTLVRHTEDLSHYLRAALVAATAAAGLLLAARWQGSRREVS